MFPTGYQANLGVLAALAGRDDLIVSDALNHASLIDGCRLSRAQVAVYPHGDARRPRSSWPPAGGFRRRLLVTESLFSMDGDVAPLAALAEAAARPTPSLVVDEAHALGACGPGGRGLCAAARRRPRRPIGTLGKAFGAAGGFVGRRRRPARILVNRARTFIFTTALPPPVAAAGRRRARHRRRPRRAPAARALDRQPPGSLTAGLMSAGLIPAAPAGPIFPVVLGSEARALTVAAPCAPAAFRPRHPPPDVPDRHRPPAHHRLGGPHPRRRRGAWSTALVETLR